MPTCQRFVMYTELGYTAGEIVFNSLSGLLRVSRHNNGKLQLDFPASMVGTNAGNSTGTIDLGPTGRKCSGL